MRTCIFWTIPLLQHKLTILRDKNTGVTRLPCHRVRNRHADVL